MGPYYEAFQIAQANGLAVGEATPPVKLAMKSGVTVVGSTTRPVLAGSTLGARLSIKLLDELSVDPCSAAKIWV